MKVCPKGHEIYFWKEKEDFSLKEGREEEQESRSEISVLKCQVC